MAQPVDPVFLEVVAGFGNRQFSTADFIDRLQHQQPELVAEAIEKHGHGGKGAGKHFSSYSWFSQQLNRLAKKGRLFKLDYRSAPDHWGSPVIRYWAATVDAQFFPEEIDNPERFIEGALLRVTVNRYERSTEAREACIARWGYKCNVCDFDFGKTYGTLGQDFIHVHHLTPISTVGEAYTLDPVADLRPVCPNCHAMLHRTNPPLSLEELKAVRSAAKK